MADQTLHSMTQDTDPTTTSELYLLEDPAGSPLNRRITAAHLLRVTNNLTADSTPDRTADYVATWDASASDMKKVLLQNLGVYTLQGSAAGGSFNPADATTYYFGNLGSEVPTTTEGRRRIRIPRAGVIRTISVFSNFTNGSSETSTMSFRLNGSSDTTISSAFAFNSAPVDANAGGLSISVTSSDYFEIKWVTPTWVTNPTSVSISFVIYIS